MIRWTGLAPLSLNKGEREGGGRERERGSGREGVGERVGERGEREERPHRGSCAGTSWLRLRILPRSERERASETGRDSERGRESG